MLAAGNGNFTVALAENFRCVPVMGRAPVLHIVSLKGLVLRPIMTCLGGWPVSAREAAARARGRAHGCGVT